MLNIALPRAPVCSPLLMTARAAVEAVMTLSCMSVGHYLQFWWRARCVSGLRCGGCPLAIGLPFLLQRAAALVPPGQTMCPTLAVHMLAMFWGERQLRGLTPAVGDSRSEGLPHSYGLIPLRANCRRCHASQDLGTSSFLDPTSVRNMSRSAFLCLAILRMPSLESVRPGRRAASSFMTHFCLLFRSKLMTLAPSFVCQVGLLMPLLSALTPGRLMAGYSARSFRPS